MSISPESWTMVSEPAGGVHRSSVARGLLHLYKTEKSACYVVLLSINNTHKTNSFFNQQQELQVLFACPLFKLLINFPNVTINAALKDWNYLFLENLSTRWDLRGTVADPITLFQRTFQGLQSSDASDIYIYARGLHNNTTDAQFSSWTFKWESRPNAAGAV